MPYMVIVSDVGRERDCRGSVRNLGFACYMPTFREQIIKQGRKVWSEKLLLGRYFFAKQDQLIDWKTVLSLRLVKGLFMRVDCELPALVKDQEIDDIRASEDVSGHVVLDPRARKGFRKGQRLRAVLGVLAGNECSYIGTGRGGCDVALLELFGRQTRIEFAPGVLQAA